MNNWTIIEKEFEYKKAITRTLKIFHVEEGSPEAEELNHLLVLVKDYEDKHVELPPV